MSLRIILELRIILRMLVEHSVILVKITPKEQVTEQEWQFSIFNKPMEQKSKK